MCDFKPGDEVVCVNASLLDAKRGEEMVMLTVGRIYTVSTVRIAKGEPHVTLAEQENFWVAAGFDFGFRARRFRKVQRRDLTAWLATENTIEEPRRAPAKKRERA